MSSSPVTPKSITPASKPITSFLTREWSWLVQHAIFAISIGCLIVVSIYTIEGIIAKHDAATASRDQAQLNVQIEQNHALIAEAQAKDVLLQQTIAALSAANAQLGAMQKARNTQLAVEVQANATLSAQQAADKLTQQTKAAPGEITASNNNVTIDLPITRNIVTDLDTLPVVQANLVDTQKQLDNETQIAVAAQNDVVAQKAQVDGLNKQIADAQKTCKAQIASVKADARKSKLKWFGLGFVAGFITGHIY